MRPASRKFRRELESKVERLRTRLDDFDAGRLPAGQNPGHDRLAEALFLQGKWDEARAFAEDAVTYWQAELARTPSDPQKCEPTFHLGSAHLFADQPAEARRVFGDGVRLFADNGLAGSDDTGYMAVVAGDLRRAEVVFHAAVVADMGAQGLADLKLFAKRFPDTPRLLKLQFAQGLAKADRELIETMVLIERWLNPEPEGITSFRTEEWFFAAHQAALAQMARGDKPRFALYDEDVKPGLVDAKPR